MHQIYEFNQTFPIKRKEVVHILENDTFIINHFNVLKEIEYLTDNNRSKGTQFRVALDLKHKVYRFKSEIKEYDRPNNFCVITYTKYGKVISDLNMSEAIDGTRIKVNCEMDNNLLSSKLILKIMQPIVKVALDRSIKNFVGAIQKTQNHN